MQFDCHRRIERHLSSEIDRGALARGDYAISMQGVSSGRTARSGTADARVYQQICGNL